MKNYKILLITGMTTTLIAGLSAPALAQERGDGSATGDIIVTARRVEERLQDVPISITVYNQEALSKRNISIASDLGAYTPSLSVSQQYGPEKSSFAIRGFNQDLSTAPSVGVYFADVVGVRAQGGTTSGNSVGAGSFMDLQNVQVLKGPQGTLFGRNTTGGAVLLVPQKPTDRLEGYVEGSAGNYDMWRAQGVINVPLSDGLRVRAAVERHSREGYMKNHSGVGAADYNDLNYFAGRFSIVADLTPDLENYTIATYSHSFTHGYGAHLGVCNPDLPVSLADIRWITAYAACDQIARQDARGGGPLDVDIYNDNPYLKIRQWQVINTTTWRASDTLTIKNIMSYGEFRERAKLNMLSDNFIDPPYFYALPPGTRLQPLVGDTEAGKHQATESTLTEELQFQGTAADGRFTWQAGGYLEFSRPHGFNALRTGIYLDCTSPANLQCTDPLGFGQVSSSASKYSFDNHGVYAQGTYKVTNRLSLTAGVRYTFDKIKAVDESTQIRFIPPAPTGGTIQTCNNLLLFNVPDGPDLDTAPDPLVVSDQSQCHAEIRTKSHKPTWQISVDYKPTNDLMLYAKYARGYRQGGINMTAIGHETRNPEKVDTYEIGAKASFNGAIRGYFNIAGFYNDFRDQQVFAYFIGDTQATGISGGPAIVNAGKSRIQGVEVDASVSPFEGLKLDLGYTYLDTKVKQISLPVASFPYIAVTPYVYEGDPLNLSPKNRATLTGTYTLPLDKSVGQLSVGATFVHTDKQVANGSGLPDVGMLPSTDLLNLNVTWNNLLGRPIDLAFFATNVTNKKYPVSVVGGYTSFGYDSFLMGQPRMWGFRMRYNFGN